MGKKKSNKTLKPDTTDDGEKTELEGDQLPRPSGEDVENEDEKFKGRIDVHTLNYFKRVEKFLDEDSFEDSESRELFINNVLAQVGEGLQTCQLAKHRLTSKVLEALLEICTASQVTGIFESLLADVLKISNDRFGSHVLEKVIGLIPKHMSKNTDNDVVIKFENLVTTFSKILKKNIDELIRSLYCSHILSAFIQMLGGMNISENVSRSRSSRNSRTKFFGTNAAKQKRSTPSIDKIMNERTTTMPESFCKILRKLAKRIINDDNFGELLCHRNASPVIQTLLLTLKENDAKLCQKLCSLIIEKSRILEWKGDGNDNSTTSPGRVPLLFADEVGSHVMEKIFYVMSEDVFEEVFTNCLKNNLLPLSLHPLANYILQHMMSSLPNEKLAAEALDELIRYTEDILASGNMGVVVRMAETCLKFKCNQKEFTKSLMKSLHMPDTKKGKNSFLRLLLSLSTYDIVYETEKAESEEKENDGNVDAKEEVQEDPGKLTKETINYHGACLVKTLLQFDDPKQLVKCLLNIDDELLLLIKHEYGSFVIESFIMSTSTNDIQRRKFVSKIQENIVAIATDKYGSHVIDKLWSQSDGEGRTIVKTELNKYKSLLKGNMYGRIILRNCGLEFEQQIKSKQNERSKASEDVLKNEDKKAMKRKDLKTEMNNQNEQEPCKKRKKEEISKNSPYIKELESLGVGVRNDEVSETKNFAMEDDAAQHDASQVTISQRERDEIDELFDRKLAKKKLNSKKSKKTRK